MFKKKPLCTLIFLFSALFLLSGHSLFAATAAPVIAVELDRDEISLDETVSLKFTIKTESTMSIGKPHFVAPDLEIINEFNSQFSESFYENGHFGMRNTFQITEILKPKRIGTFQIQNLELMVAGKKYTAPSQKIKVIASGQGTPPPRNYGAPGLGLRGASRNPSKKGFMVRAEVNKQKVYKGEQVIISYFLYQRSRTFNIQTEKYPVFNGFLREELEMPILGNGRLNSENVMLDGTAYTRSLLARYAAYPLKEGKLPLDTLDIRANYYSNQSVIDDDPVFNLFQQMSPQSAVSKSEPIPIEVLPLPEAGKPASFSGAVGDFTISAAANKTTVKANEAITLTVIIEGKGNSAAIQEPTAKWPDTVELYDSKAKTKTSRGGVGEKTFELLLIPRTPGRLTLPALEFSFFDPHQARYITRTTQPISIQVDAAAPGSVPAMNHQGFSPQKTASPSGISQNTAVLDIQPDGSIPLSSTSVKRVRLLKILNTLIFASLGSLLALVLFQLVRRRFIQRKLTQVERELSLSKSWQKLLKKGHAAIQGAPWSEVSETYELLAGACYDAIDRSFSIPIGARSHSRAELRLILIQDHEVPESVWNRLAKLLEFIETVRFASSAGAISEQAAREQLIRWIREAQEIETALLHRPPHHS